MDDRMRIGLSLLMANGLGAGRRALAAVILLAASANAVSAEPAKPDDIAALKRKYLHCDREATSRRLDPGEAQECSLVAEALLRREFEGDFERLLSWWRGVRFGVAAP